MSGFYLVKLSNSVKQVRNGLWLFVPKEGSQGIASWWLESKPEPVLIDCPEINSDVLNDLKELSKGYSPRIILTHRDAHGHVSQLNKKFGWPVLIQEQESYLLPAIKNLETFNEEFITCSKLKLLWTPGPTPGSCIIYAPSPWNVLFCGRLLIPVANDQISSIRSKRTFHWSFQQMSLKKLLKWIPLDLSPALASSEGMHILGDEKILPWEAWENRF